MVSEYTGTGKFCLIRDESVMEYTPDSIHYNKDRSRFFKDAEFPTLRIKEETIEDSFFLESRVSRAIPERGILAKVIAHVKNRLYFLACFTERICGNFSSKPKYKIGRHNHCFYV